MRKGNKPRADVVIVTAIPIEYQAVLEVSEGAVSGTTWAEGQQDNGAAMSERSYVASNGQPLRIVVALAPDMGVSAFHATMDPLIERFDPRCIAMCGVCAGRRGKVQLGDVVVAERVFLHDTGKVTRAIGEDPVVQQDLRTFSIRPDWKIHLERWAAQGVVESFRGQPWLDARPLTAEWRDRRALLAMDLDVSKARDKIDPRLRDDEWPAIVARLREEGWVHPERPQLTDAGRASVENLRFLYPGNPDLSPYGDLHPFRLHVAPMATGSRVIEDEEIWTFITPSMRKTLGLDMEAAAVGAAAHYLHQRKLDFIVMKGVMDFADHGRDDHYKEFAARASAECLLAFLRQQLEPKALEYDAILSPGTSALTVVDAPPSRLLHPRYQVVPWYGEGREGVLAALEEWADSDPPVAVQLLHGEGGIGKTRLATEWIQQRRARGDVAGFLRMRPEKGWLDAVRTSDRRVVAVVDYAESRGDLEEVIEALEVLQESSGPSSVLVRLLLLARSDGDWWDSLRSGRESSRALLATAGVRPLGQIAVQAPARRQLFEHAARAFASHRGLTAVASLEPPFSLSEEQFGRVLAIHAAALIAVELAAGQRRRPELHTSVFDEVLDHERRYWPSQSGATRRLAGQIVAAATLRGGFQSYREARVLAERLAAASTLRGDELENCLTALANVYGTGAGEGAYIAGLEPDLLGESHILRLLNAAPGSKEELESDWIDRILPPETSPERCLHAFTVLGRSSAHHEEAARLAKRLIERLLTSDLAKRAPLAATAARAVGTKTIESILGQCLAEGLESNGTTAIAESLNESVLSSVSLRKVALWQSRTLLDAAPSSEDGDVAAMSVRAHRLRIHATNLRSEGDHALALEMTEESSAIYALLVDKDAATYMQAHIGCLLDLATARRMVGELTAARRAAEDAVRLSRTLNGAARLQVLPVLGSSLNTLANVCVSAGDGEGAVDAATESLAQYEELYTMTNGASWTGLSLAFFTLGVARRSARDLPSALQATERAVDMYSQLASHDQDAFLPDYALALLNLGAIRNESGYLEGAIDATEEAVRKYKRLVARDRAAFLFDLARAQSNLGRQRSANGDRFAAVRATEKAVALYEELGATAPHVMPEVARAWKNLVAQRFDVDDLGGALQAALEAVKLYRELASKHREAVLPELAMSVGNLAAAYHQCDKLAEAKDAADEAVKLSRELVKKRGAVAWSDLARSLGTSAGVRVALGDRQGALRDAEEAMELYRKLAAKHSDAFLGDLAKILINLASLRKGRKALEASQEAVRLMRHLYARHPAAYEGLMVTSLEAMAQTLEGLGKGAEAAVARNEARSLVRSSKPTLRR